MKNFAFRLSATGEWDLAPAYDLVFAEGPGGEHTMTVAGEGREPGARHLFALAERAGLAAAEARSVLAEVVAAVERWDEHAREATVGKETRRAIGAILATCLGRLSL